jgi:hypothetical protein
MKQFGRLQSLSSLRLWAVVRLRGIFFKITKVEKKNHDPMLLRNMKL